MRLVPIAPYDLLDTQDNIMQLLLPKHLLVSDTYGAWHAHPKRHPGYKILDNGVAEAEKVQDLTLLHLAFQYKVNELVLPDVLGNSHATVRASLDFVQQHFLALDELVHGQKVKLAIVAQGNDAHEAVATVEQVIGRLERFGFLRDDFAIHVPRLLLKTGITQRTLVKRLLDAEYRDIPFHALGTDGAHLGEITRLAKAGFRSCDTSAAYNYARALRHVKDYAWKHVVRQPGYFEWTADDRQLALLDENLKLMNRWANV